jgi:hypothetical protein
LIVLGVAFAFSNYALDHADSVLIWAFEDLFFPGHCLGERLLALVALDVGNTFLDASPNTTPTPFLASAIFLYITRADFGDLGDLRKPCLTRFGKFCGVCFNAGYKAALAGLNSSTFCLDVG